MNLDTDQFVVPIAVLLSLLIYYVTVLLGQAVI